LSKFKYKIAKPPLYTV